MLSTGLRQSKGQDSCDVSIARCTGSTSGRLQQDSLSAASLLKTGPAAGRASQLKGPRPAGAVEVVLPYLSACVLPGAGVAVCLLPNGNRHSSVAGRASQPIWPRSPGVLNVCSCCFSKTRAGQVWLLRKPL
jgi:hypothetical protein